MKGAAGAPQQSITEGGDHVRGQEGDAHSGAGGGGRQADTLQAWADATIGAWGPGGAGGSDHGAARRGPGGERGQVWCYQGGSDYYRLGYVFIQRYYEPTLFRPFVEIRVYSSAGQPPDSGWMCDDELLRGEATRGL
jgi:hypothetical protein